MLYKSFFLGGGGGGGGGRWGVGVGKGVRGFTPCKAEQPLQDIELQEKEAQKC